MANPNPWPMKDATNNDSLHNHGFTSESLGSGQTLVKAYGLDRSGEVGTAGHERDTPRGLKGGVTNLSHSIKGASANQTGRS